MKIWTGTQRSVGLMTKKRTDYCLSDATKSIRLHGLLLGLLETPGHASGINDPESIMRVLFITSVSHSLEQTPVSSAWHSAFPCHRSGCWGQLRVRMSIAIDEWPPAFLLGKIRQRSLVHSIDVRDLLVYIPGLFSSFAESTQTMPEVPRFKLNTGALMPAVGMHI